MVIDDDPILGKMISQLLKRSSHFDVKFFSDVPKAIKNLKKQEFDILLLDWMMPDICGLDVLSELKSTKETKDLPVFMLTQRKSGEDFEAACDLGIDGYFTKPADPLYIKNRLISFLNA